ncbi:MAG: oligosaccharide flippase family protein [Candidatus Thorarchaeota archaeon]|nr:oligosaccharide flippase family protein [Candidatus Thorarchaeota archaeon]
MEEYISRDKFSFNVVAESASRILSFAGGLLSSAVLYRSIGWSWSTADYTAVKMVSSASQMLLPLVLLGFSGALTRYVAASSNDRRKVGQGLGNSLVIVTFAYIATATLSSLFGLDRALIASGLDVQLPADETRLLWFFVMLSLLPSGYLSIARAAFAGVQKMKRGLTTEIVYNSIRIASLVILYAYQLVMVLTILWLNLLLTVIACVLALRILATEMKRNSVPWCFRPSSAVIGSLAGLAGVFLVSTVVQAIFDYGMVILVGMFGADEDVANFSIARATSLTVMQIVTSPLGVLAPNLALEYAAGSRGNLERKFKEAYRMMVPTLSFTAAALFAFSQPILRVVYGAAGVSAVPFLRLLSMNPIFMVVPAIYLYILLAADDRRGLLLSSILQGAIQVGWVMLMAPLIGVIAVALIWIPYVPFFFLQHWYTKKYHSVTMDLQTVAGGIGMGLFFLVVMYAVVTALEPIVAVASIPNIVEAMLVGLMAIPFWYLFIAVGTATKVVNRRDLENISKVLKVIPPAWWVSRPLVTRLMKVAEQREAGLTAPSPATEDAS